MITSRSCCPSSGSQSGKPYTTSRLQQASSLPGQSSSPLPAGSGGGSHLALLHSRSGSAEERGCCSVTDSEIYRGGATCYGPRASPRPPAIPHPALYHAVGRPAHASPPSKRGGGGGVCSVINSGRPCPPPQLVSALCPDCGNTRPRRESAYTQETRAGGRSAACLCPSVHPADAQRLGHAPDSGIQGWSGSDPSFQPGGSLCCAAWPRKRPP